MPRISQIAAGAFAAALAFTSVASFAAGSSDPETDQVKSRVVERLGVRPTTVAKTPFGLWEISVAPDQVFYVDGNVRYLLLGNAVDIATRENLTEKRIAEISRVASPLVRSGQQAPRVVDRDGEQHQQQKSGTAIAVKKQAEQQQDQIPSLSQTGGQQKIDRQQQR